MADDPDARRCPECRSTNIHLESTREHLARRPGDPDPPVVARTLHIRCRRCGAGWDVLKRGPG